MSQEAAWAAGFFDGEGTAWCFHGKRQTHRSLVFIQAGQCDRRPLLRFQEALGGLGNIFGPYKRPSRSAWKPYSYWKVSGKGLASALGVLWPHLSEPKREQIKAAMCEAGKRNKTFSA